MEKQWVVVYTDIRPMQCWGPFVTSDEAITWAEDYCEGWHVLPILCLNYRSQSDPNKEAQDELVKGLTPIAGHPSSCGCYRCIVSRHPHLGERA